MEMRCYVTVQIQASVQNDKAMSYQIVIPFGNYFTNQTKFLPVKEVVSYSSHSQQKPQYKRVIPRREVLSNVVDWHAISGEYPRNGRE